jgi:two-component system response regulator YesN
MLWRKKKQQNVSGYVAIYTRLAAGMMLLVLLPVVIIGNWFYFTYRSNSRMHFNEMSQSYVNEITFHLQTLFSSLEKELTALSDQQIFLTYQRAGSPDFDVDILQRISTDLQYVQRKYNYVDSVYFADLSTNSIFAGENGLYDLTDYYDVEWIKTIPRGTSIQYLPVRVNADASSLSFLQHDYHRFIFPEHVISLVRSDGTRFFAINISVVKLVQYLQTLYTLADDVSFSLYQEDSVLLSLDHGVMLPFGTELPQHYDSETGSSVLEYSNSFCQGLFTCTLSYDPWIADENSQVFLRFLIIICVILGTVLILLVFIMGRSLYNPMNNLLEEIRGLSTTFDQEDLDSTKDEIQIIKKIYSKLSQDNSTQNAASERENWLRYYFKEYIAGCTSCEEFQKQMETHRFYIADKYYQLLLFQGQGNNVSIAAWNQIQTAVSAFLHQGEYGICIYMNHNRLLVVLVSSTFQQTEKICATLMELRQALFSFPLYIGCSGIENNLEDFPKLYRDAEEGANTAVFFDLPNQGTGPLAEKPPWVPYYDHLKKLENNLVQGVSTKRKDVIDAQMEKIYEWVLQSRCIDFGYRTYEILALSLGRTFSMSLDGMDLVSNIDQYNTLQQLHQMLQGQIEKITCQLEGIPTENRYCVLAKQYMQEHYMENLSVSDIAGALNISYPYLSKLFKDTMQISMMDYLNKIRIQQAKQLLSLTTMSLSDIATAVGYQNVQSFQRFFKKYESITPGEYRKMF